MPSPRALVALVFVLLLVTVGPASPYRSPISLNESAAFGDIRTLMTAQEVYAANNGGREFYTADPRCLTTPSSCLPGYAATAPTFLDAAVLAPGPRQGYVRTLHAGPAATPAQVKELKLAPFSVTCFAVTAVPLRPVSGTAGGLAGCFVEKPTGVRGFCGDCSGRICYTDDGSAPAVKDGRCEPCPKPYP